MGGLSLFLGEGKALARLLCCELFKRPQLFSFSGDDLADLAAGVSTSPRKAELFCFH